MPSPSLYKNSRDSAARDMVIRTVEIETFCGINGLEWHAKPGR
jgi:hypothetical protein